MDEQTLEIRAAEFTTSDLGDAPMRPELLKQIPPDQEIGSVTADGAYDTRKCHEAIAHVAPPRSYRLAGAPSRGSPTPPERRRAIRLCAPQGASVGPSGDNEAAITAGAAQRPR
jgi:hypothetical protein